MLKKKCGVKKCLGIIVALSMLICMSISVMAKDNVCHRCKGTGEIVSTEKCGSCGGDGKMIGHCPDCGGTGSGACQACKGTGHTEDGELCEECMGTCRGGSCRRCSGSGVIHEGTCNACKGTGFAKETCPECNGRGVIE